MISAVCACCGSPAEEHHDDYPDGAGWFCADCMPGPQGHALRTVNAWQSLIASTHVVDIIPRRSAVVVPFRRRRRVRLRGAA